MAQFYRVHIDYSETFIVLANDQFDAEEARHERDLERAILDGLSVITEPVEEESLPAGEVFWPTYEAKYTGDAETVGEWRAEQPAPPEPTPYDEMANAAAQGLSATLPGFEVAE